MKLSPIKNDKSTAADELIFAIITLIILVGGVMLVVFRPVLGVIGSNITLGFGIVMIILASMYIPCIIYRLFTNDKK